MNNDELKKYLSEKQISSKLRQQERAKSDYVKNKDTIMQRVKTRYNEKREECIEKQKLYNKLNAEKQKVYAKEYYRKKKSEGEVTPRVEKPKIVHCITCDIDVSKTTRYTHFYSNRHLRKLAEQESKDATEQDLIDILLSTKNLE